jgi:hypothetical protein
MATGRVPTTANSPLTAKGDLFTYSTAPARLAVSDDGSTLVADSAATTGLRWQPDFSVGRNKIINGDFRINQRNFTSRTTSGYCFDRWTTGLTNGGGTVTFSAETFALGAAPVLGYEGTNFFRCVTSGQTDVDARAAFRQNIESVKTFAGQTVTISFWAKAGSGTPSLNTEIAQLFGTGGSPSAEVSTAGTKQAITTSWARYSWTIAVPSISGKTIGTAGDDMLRLNIWASAGSNWNSASGTLGIQNNTFDIWGVQVEAGSVATAFQTATGTLQGELAACQRYYEKFNSISVQVSASGGNLSCILPTQVTMRTAPSVTHGMTNANYTTAWDLDVAYVTDNVAKTGTVSINVGSSVDHIGLFFTGATWASTPNILNVGYVEASSEL